VQESPLQCPQQTVDFVDASVYRCQLFRRPGLVGRGSLMVISGYAIRKLLQFGAFGLQKPLEHARLSYLSGLSRAARQDVCRTQRRRPIDGSRVCAGGVPGSA
jgi:hypothetical protein